MPSKKIKCCGFCNNHNETNRLRGHVCLLKDCSCKLCNLTRSVQKAMRHQQRFWRHQKNRLHVFINDPSFRIDADLLNSDGQIICQVCDKCRNHNHLTRKKNHICPYISCDCSFCSLTSKRQEVMKHQQRIRRSKITTKVSRKSQKNLTSSENLSPRNHDIGNELKSQSTDEKRNSNCQNSLQNQTKISTLPSSGIENYSYDIQIHQNLQLDTSEERQNSPPPLINMFQASPDTYANDSCSDFNREHIYSYNETSNRSSRNYSATVSSSVHHSSIQNIEIQSNDFQSGIHERDRYNIREQHPSRTLRVHQTSMNMKNVSSTGVHSADGVSYNFNPQYSSDNIRQNHHDTQTEYSNSLLHHFRHSPYSDSYYQPLYESDQDSRNG